MAKRTCSIDGCDAPMRARGWCASHYYRWQKYGDAARDLTKVRNGGPCLVEGCRRRSTSRGMCNKHYQRALVHGDPTGGYYEKLEGSPIDRFMACVDKADDGGCWRWTRGVSGIGYAEFTIGGHTHLGHRWAYEHFVGPIPDGMTIDHVCHTVDLLCTETPCMHRRCVNPAHMEVVSLAENSRRAAERRRLVAGLS